MKAAGVPAVFFISLPHEHIFQHAQRNVRNEPILFPEPIRVEVLSLDRLGLLRVTQQIHNEGHLSGSLLPLETAPRIRELHQLAERERVGIYSGNSCEFEDEVIN